MAMAVAIALVSSTYLVDNHINYKIQKPSHIYLSGTSNVADYRCDCDELVQSDNAFYVEKVDDQKMVFKNAVVKLKTKSFDCGNMLITGEMHDALQAKEQPYITIELKEMDIPEPKSFLALKNKCYYSNGKADITIAGKKRTVDLLIKHQKVNETTYRFGGTKKLKMTDFSITPPMPAMGLIQVDNGVEIELDLNAKTLN